MAVGNIYLIAAISIIGGGLFGFDISSMSAIIGTTQYKCYFNQGPTPATPDDCSGPEASVQGGITAAMPGGERDASRRRASPHKQILTTKSI